MFWASHTDEEWVVHYCNYNNTFPHRPWQLLTYLVVEFRKLDFNLLPLEHVILCLFANGWDLIELSCHRVRLLQQAQGTVTPYSSSTFKKCQPHRKGTNENPPRPKVHQQSPKSQKDQRVIWNLKRGGPEHKHWHHYILCPLCQFR